MQSQEFICNEPAATFEIGESISARLKPGDVILLFGALGAGKTLLSKGILYGLQFDVDEVTSPSFSLVNLYKTPSVDVYHIDLWRLDERSDVPGAVGLYEILDSDNSLTIIEWAEKLKEFSHDGRIIRVSIEGDGEEPRTVSIEWPQDEM